MLRPCPHLPPDGPFRPRSRWHRLVPTLLCHSYKALHRYESKTNKQGECSWVGVSYGTYRVEVFSSTGEGLYTNDRGVSVQGDANGFVADMAHPEASGGRAGASTDSERGGSTKKMSKEERAKKQEEENARVNSLNGLITQAQTAMQAQNWAEAETASTQLIP